MAPLALSPLPAAIELVVATLELKAVRAITDAVRANLISAGGIPGPLGTVEMPGPFPGRVDPVDRFEPRQVVTPTTYFEPREIIRPTPRVEIEPSIPIQPEQPSRLDSPLEPVWRMPIEPDAPIPPRRIKYGAPPVDLQMRGRQIDLFI